MDKTMELLSKNFLVCCYFGQSEDLIKAAIDRAYVDMASHTLQYNKFTNDENGINEKWKCRFEVYKKIFDSLREYPLNNDNFDDWHRSVINEIKIIYVGHDLSEGQAQKWLNMTIKYIYIFANLFGSEDERLTEISCFLNNTSADDYKCPIDSYVIKGAKVDYVPWSGLNTKNYIEKYNEIKQKIGNQNDFIWELENWETFAKKTKPDKMSYAAYYDKNTV